MPYVNYEEVSKRMPTIRAQRLELYPEVRRRIVSRLKDQEEIDVLVYLDLLRMQRWEKEGKLVCLGNRKYRLMI